MGIAAEANHGSIVVAIPPLRDPAALARPGEEYNLHALRGETMGTVWSTHFFCRHDQMPTFFLAVIERELEKILAQMSHWRDDSDLARFNRAALHEWQPLPNEFLQVLECALDIAAHTQGAFDPTLGAIVNEWGFGPRPKPSTPPPVMHVSALRSQCGWQYLELDHRRGRARRTAELALDLSAIAKGFAVDELARLLSSLGAPSYLVEIGGELRAAGVKSDGSPWWAAIELPGAPETHQIRVALTGWSIATSGDYRRYTDYDGRRYAHTIDPRTGVPLENPLCSVSVVHADCMAADAYATALLVMGAEAGMRFAEENRIPAVFVLRTRDGLTVRCSESFYRMAS